MRFLRLDLRAFGPFADAPPLELAGGARGLHLIHGPNEAGKSSALRAIRILLFGFPHRSDDNHLHHNDKLRVAASVRSDDDSTLAFVRRKKDVNSLWTFDDLAPIAPDALEPFLGGLDEGKFVDLFSMDHAELVAGGRSILRGGGRLGEMLFAAGSGLARVDEVRKRLDEELKELFLPGGKNPSINAALLSLKEARDDAESRMLATSSWVELDATLAREEARKAEILGEVRTIEAEKRKLERLGGALPVIRKRDAAASKLEELAGVPILSEGFADRRREATVAREAGLKAALSAEQTLEEIDRELADLGPTDPVLDEADAIRRLRDDLVLYRKALEGRPDELARLARVEDDARAILEELRPDASIGGADIPRVEAATRERVQDLGRELARLDDRLEQAGSELARRQGECPGPGPTAGPDAPRLASALAEAVDRAQLLGDLEAQLAEARAERAKADRQAAVDLKALPLWSGTLEELEALAVPSASTLDRFEIRAREAADRLGRASQELATAELERSRLDREIDRVQHGGPVPTEAELAARRLDRDEGWRSVRRAWIGREPVADPPVLADAFEGRLRAVDDLADRLRREAGLVAEQAQLGLRRLELSARVVELAGARARAEADREASDREWRDLWRAAGLTPLPPREMKDWVAIRRADLVRKAQGLRDLASEVDRRSSKVDEIKAELSRHLAKLGEPGAEPDESLPALIARSRSAVARVASASRLAEAVEAMAKAEADRSACRARWAGAVGPLGLDADASPSAALAVLGRLDELARLRREARDVRDRIAEHARAEARFEAEARALADRLAPDLAGQPAEATAHALARRFEGAQVKEARRSGALKRRQDERARRSEARAEVDRAEATLSGLVLEARCGSPEGLAEAERASDESKAQARLVLELDEQLATLAGPMPVDRLRVEAQGVDPEALDARVSDLTARLVPLKEEADRLGEQVGRCRERLDAMDGGPAAAEAQQLVEERVARLALDIEKYARLRLASAVLREAVERYRKEHQGPVLDRAGDLFRRLTAGSFSGLRAEVDEKGQPVLRGVRAAVGTPLGVEGMSEGTADQLYLALRLASLETYLDDHEPMPLVVDDVLVNFDNARALAALEALAELSKRTQVLFFTHHEHLVDLARSSLGGDVLFVHSLVQTGPRLNGHAEVIAVKPGRKKKAAPAAGEA